MPQDQTSKQVEVFRPGTFRSANGVDTTFTKDDIDAIANSYDAEKLPAPVVVGHPQHDDPAYGWVEGFSVSDDGTLEAKLHKLAPSFVDAVGEGRYRKISMSFFTPDHPANPKPGGYYPKHVGFLGGAAPAVSGLVPVQFKNDGGDELVVEYAGTATAYNADQNAFAVVFHSPTDVLKGDQMSDDTQKELAQREAKIAVQERALREKEANFTVGDWIDKGKLTPALKEKATQLVSFVSQSDGEALEFASGQSASLLELLKDIIEGLPTAIEFSESAGGKSQKDSGSNAQSPAYDYSMTAGTGVDPDSVALDQKVQNYMTQNPGVDYVAALDAVSQ